MSSGAAPVLKFIEATKEHMHVLEYGNDFDCTSSAEAARGG